jgi:hypothetical protein
MVWYEAIHQSLSEVLLMEEGIWLLMAVSEIKVDTGEKHR